ncbi:MAG: helix-turn-helix family protein [Gemmatimonadetes bacterium]|nr:helix-turn-helix family protein [Gemmatimonadota bacterium]
MTVRRRCIRSDIGGGDAMECTGPRADLQKQVCKISISDMDSSVLADRVARRIKWHREHQNLTQQQVSDAMGFKDRQTFAAIEAGDRAVTPDELVSAATILQCDIDDLFDPFRLTGEGDFNFRAEPDATADAVDSFAQQAGRWIATYRELGRQAGQQAEPLSQKLDIRRDSSFEHVQASAESLAKRWKLGDVPAMKLEEAVTRELGVLVLHVDAPKGISGAASQLPGLRTILINRREPRGRRFYNLAHELFHLLTWDALPPQRVEPLAVEARKGNRVEQLANNFAAALLMPEPVVSANWARRGELDVTAWVLLTAKVLCVSPDALQWRIVNLRMITKGAMKRLKAMEEAGAAHLPELFSRPFVERVQEAVDAGRLSLRRAASLLDLTVVAFADLCRAYHLSLSYEFPAQA